MSVAENLMIVFALASVVGLLLATQVDNEPLAGLGIKVLLASIMGASLFATQEFLETLLRSSLVTYAAACTLTLAAILFATGVVMRIEDRNSWKFVWMKRKSMLVGIAVIGTVFSVINGLILFTNQ